MSAARSLGSALRLAARTFTASRGRLLASVGGVALAFALILTLDAILLGVTKQLTRYIDDSGADVIVAQSGVRNLHMVASSLPATSELAIQRVNGVEATTPLLYVTGTVSARDAEAVAYVFGVPPDAEMGMPAKLAEGREELGPGEAIIDVHAARRLGVARGGSVSILGRPFEVVGLSEGTSNLVNSMAFIRMADFAAARPAAPASGALISYVLVRIAAGADAEQVAATIERVVPGTTALARAAFADEERRLVMDMSGDVVALMDLIGLIVGLAVVALTVYVATLARRREFGIMKAIGASNRYLFVLVIGAAIFSVAMGLLAGVGFTAVLAVAVPLTGADLLLAIGSESVLKVSAMGALIALASALLPVREVAGLDPAAVFRRGAA